MIDLTLRCPVCGARADMCFAHGDAWKKRSQPLGYLTSTGTCLASEDVTIVYPESIEPREGILTVYDHTGRYVGCIGSETWRRLLDEEAVRV